MGAWPRRSRSGSTRAERDRERRDRFIARYSKPSLVQFAAVALLVNALAACALGALTGWSNAVIVFVLWTLIEVVARSWAMRQVRRPSAGEGSAPVARTTTQL